MSYDKTIWKSKDIITREKMQKIEDQLEVLSEQESSGTSDYLELENKPQINGVTLTGNKPLTDLGVAAASDVAAKYTKPETGIPASDLSSAVQASLQKAEAGSLSTLGATAGQVPVADGNGSWAWATPSGGSSNVLIVNITNQFDEETRILSNVIDKTWQEIHDALASGVYVFNLNVLGESVHQNVIQGAYIDYRGQYAIEIDGGVYSTDNKNGYPSYSLEPVN